MDHLYICCRTCKRRQRLKDTSDKVLSLFIKAHNNHRIFVETAVSMGTDILSYSEQWPSKKPAWDTVKPPIPEFDLLDKARTDLMKANRTIEEQRLRIKELQLIQSKEGSPEREQAIREYRDAIKGIVDDGISRIAIPPNIFSEEDLEEIRKAGEDPWTKIPKEVRDAIREESN